LSTSLEELVSLLLKSGKENFVETVKYLGDHDLVFAKGVHLHDRQIQIRRDSTASHRPFLQRLERRTADSARLRSSPTDLDTFDIQNLKQFHDHYLVSDVLLLSDVFQHFSHTTFDAHRLDCLHFFTLPSLAWYAVLKHTKAELNLITDPNIYLMIENSMRGGIAVISKRQQPIRRRIRRVATNQHTSMPITSMVMLKVNHYQLATSGFSQKKK